MLCMKKLSIKLLKFVVSVILLKQMILSSWIHILHTLTSVFYKIKHEAVLIDCPHIKLNCSKMSTAAWQYVGVKCVYIPVIGRGPLQRCTDVDASQEYRRKGEKEKKTY